eukprot:775230_1
MSTNERIDLQAFALVTIGKTVIYCRSYTSTSNTLSQDIQREIACSVLQAHASQPKDTHYYCSKIESLDGHLYSDTTNNLTQVSALNNNIIPVYILRIQCHNIFINKATPLERALSTAKRQYHCRRCTLHIRYCCKAICECVEPILKCIGYALCIITCCWICMFPPTCSDRSPQIDSELAASSRRDDRVLTSRASTRRSVEVELETAKPTTVTEGISADSVPTMHDLLSQFGASQWGGGAPSVTVPAYRYHYSDKIVDTICISSLDSDDKKIDKQPIVEPEDDYKKKKKKNKTYNQI